MSEENDPKIFLPVEPIFAPIPYGDDRQIIRTRRGVLCEEELKLDPNIVYCECYSCGYEWIISKEKYITGTESIGGSGDIGAIPYQKFGKYNRRLQTCCVGGVGFCKGEGDEVSIGTFYPYVYTTDPNTGEEIRELGEPEDVTIECIGGSGSSAPEPEPHKNGGQYYACPHCCKVNFQCKWLIPDDNPGLKSGSVCTSIIVIDFQRIKSDAVSGLR